MANIRTLMSTTGSQFLAHCIHVHVELYVYPVVKTTVRRKRSIMDELNVLNISHNSSHPFGMINASTLFVYIPFDAKFCIYSTMMQNGEISGGSSYRINASIIVIIGVKYSAMKR